MAKTFDNDALESLADGSGGLTAALWLGCCFTPTAESACALAAGGGKLNPGGGRVVPPAATQFVAVRRHL